MGITVEEYLKEREACQVCETTENQEYCVTHMLSRPDNCLIYNSIIYNSYPVDNVDVKYLQNLRASPGLENTVLEYYLRSEPIVKKIRSIHHQNPAIWDAYYFRFVKNIIGDLKSNLQQEAIRKIFNMLIELETEVLNKE